MNSKENNINKFFYLLIISIAGNYIAEWALMWYAINNLNIGTDISSNNALSFFFVGQAVGAIFIAPVLSVLFDKLPKRSGAILLDLSLIGIFLVSLGLYMMKLLTPEILFLVTVIATSIGIVYRSGVTTFIPRLVENEEMRKKLAVNATLFDRLGHAIGGGLSGAVFYLGGFESCLILGILTFIPLLFLYSRIFEKEEPFNYAELISVKEIKSIFVGYKEGFQALLDDKILLVMGLSIGIYNVSGALIPAFLGISFKNEFGEKGAFFSIILGAGLVLAFLTRHLFSKISEDMKINNIVPLSSFPVIVAAVICSIYPHPVSFTILYLIACLSSNLRNVTTAKLRSSERVKKEIHARLNTFYVVLIYLGQVIGGLFVIPVFGKNLSEGSLVAVGTFIISAIFAYVLLPKKKLKESYAK